MALPADVTENYLASAPAELRWFWAIVAKRAPADVQSRVSEFTSQVSEEKCIFRDRVGTVLYETPDPPPPVKPPEPIRTPAPSSKHLQSIETRLDLTRQMFLDIAKGITSVHERLVAIESFAEEVRRIQEEERRGISFRGPWQVAIDYEQGAIVTYSERAYVASKAIRCGGQPPARHGSGWLHMFDSTEIPR